MTHVLKKYTLLQTFLLNVVGNVPVALMFPIRY